MRTRLFSSSAVWLAGGVVIGLGLGMMWPQTPIHAVATDRVDNFALATGPLDDDTEALFYLDFLSGDLKATALSPIARKFFASFTANVNRDLGVDLAKNPKYLMVTGNSIFRRGGGQVQPGNSVVYVAELTSGKVAAYAVPWSQAYANAGRQIHAPLVLLDVQPMRVSLAVEE
ncbi:MAG TPA: hypothetical protein VFI31_30680 [Pirellulales bacterium]|nr:hypothetical protein [Pirellulales bacterium]